MSPSDLRPEETIAAHYEEAVQWRRQLHRNPQPAWLEFYATGFVAEKLAEWGYDLLLGKDIIEADKRVVVPDLQTLEVEYGRAIGSGIKEQFIAPARGGYTGVVGVLKGALPGPVVVSASTSTVLKSSNPPIPLIGPQRRDLSRKTRVMHTCAATTFIRPWDCCWPGISPKTAKL